MSDTNPSLDLTSKNFDASTALGDHKTRQEVLSLLPCPSAKTFNNLNEYSIKTFKKDVCPVTPSSLPLQRQFTQEQVDAVKAVKKRKPMSNVLTRMQCLVKCCGPMHVLHQSIGRRILILIRRRKFGPPDSQFSWLSALLVAFDRHQNLVLHDVLETVSKLRPKSETRLQSEQEKGRRKRHFKRLFVRGDSIQVVSMTSSGVHDIK